MEIRPYLTTKIKHTGTLEIFLKQVNDRVQSFERTMNDLTRSLGFTQGEVDDLKGELRQLTQNTDNQETSQFAGRSTS